MPAVTASLAPPPDSNVTLEPPNKSQAPDSLRDWLGSNHIYIAVAALAVFILVRLASPRIAPSYCQRRKTRGATSSDLPRDLPKRESFVHRQYPGPAADERLAQLQGPTPAARLPLQALPAGRKPGQVFWVPDPRRMGLLEMEGAHDNGSRGVSSGHHLPPAASSAASPTSPGTVTAQGRRTSRQHSPRSSSSRRYSGTTTASLDGRDKGAMAHGGEGYIAAEPVPAPGSAEGDFDLDYAAPFARRFSRPPPPPPLTPPTLSTAIFTFEDRRPSYAVSIPPELDTTTFFHQPNPDYHADVGAIATGSSSSSPARHGPGTPRRRSYNKTLPIAVPMSGAESMLVGADPGFSPSSYPPASPRLPPPPPGLEGFGYEYYEGIEEVVAAEDESLGMEHASGSAQQREIDVQGEIISVLDESGAGWKRHTRVYGGGVCLACVAAGGGGGFYGDKVRPEDRR